MTERDHLFAELVYDKEYVTLPSVFSHPRGDQLQGTCGEQLAEIAGRSCYDSFGQGRDSESYHKHILFVGHLSVYEHYNTTVEFLDWDWEVEQSIMRALIGRPGVWVCENRVTFNPRVLLDWHKIRPGGGQWVYNALYHRMQQLMPNAMPYNHYSINAAEIVAPETDEEKWISMFMGGSRGFSHEQVRHGDFTAISQRSTRYVDESEGSWIRHPLLCEYLADTGDTWLAGDLTVKVEGPAKAHYGLIVERMIPWLVSRGLSTLDARKQARGAARGFLGNALYTEMLFSASVAQWKRMISQRAHPAADAEIRELYERYVIPALKGSRYGDSF